MSTIVQEQVFHRYGKTFSIQSFTKGKTDVEVNQDGFPIILPNCSSDDLYAIAQFLTDVAEGI